MKDNNKRIETWVKKEAYSKLKGLGLQLKFQSINLDEIKVSSLFIENNEYMCAIYCDNEDINFVKIDIIGKNNN